jgi:predicted  nucleic acid-binding Zn-ribbon protein
MPAAISETIKKIVLHDWLEGRSREEISSRNKISTGAVSNIIEEWRTDLANYDIDALRVLSLSLKKFKITPEKSAAGIRVAIMMRKIGVTEESFNYFINDIFHRCQTLDISANEIGTLIGEVVMLLHHIMPSKIPEFLDEKRKEIESSENETEQKREKLLQLDKEVTQVQNGLDSLVEKEKTSLETIEWLSKIRQELKNEGIPVDEVEAFVQCIKGIKKKNYDPEQVVLQYSDYEGLNIMIETLQKFKEDLKIELEGLQFQLSIKKEEINKNRLKLDKIGQLEKIGFGLQELKILDSTLTEIALENDLENDLVIQKFFSDLTDYEKTTGFRKLLEKNVQENDQLNQQLTIVRRNLSAHSFLGPTLENLLNKNVSEKDIMDINAILFSEGGGSDYFTKDNFDKQSLIQDIQKYKTIKESLSSLDRQKNDLEKEIIKLEKNKERLEKYMDFYMSFLSESGSFAD